MSELERWILDGRIVAVVLTVLVVELAVLASLRRRLPRALREYVANACAGGSIAVALYGSLTGASATFIGGFLVLGGVAHATDLTLRLRH